VWLAVASQHTNVLVWNVTTRTLARELPIEQPRGDPALVVHPSKPIVAVVTDRLLFWDIELGRLVDCVTGIPDKVTQAAAFSPDGRWFALGLPDGVALWKLFERQPPAVYQTQGASTRALGFSRSSGRLAVGDDEGKIMLLEVTQGRWGATFEGHTRMVVDLAFTPEDKSLVSVGWDGTIRFWCLANHQLELTLSHGGAPVTGVAFSPDGNTMATSGADGTVRLWPAAPRLEAAPVTPVRAESRTARRSPSAERAPLSFLGDGSGYESLAQ
jgi:WD40 repeat protein